jgi:hypothetical protein
VKDGGLRHTGGVTADDAIANPPHGLALSARKKTAPMMEAVKIRLLSVDNTRSAIMVNIPVVIAPLNDDSVVAVTMIIFADDVTVAVPVTISVTLSNRYANRTNTNPDLFRSSRHCTANSNHGGDHYGILNHCVLLSLLSSGRAIPGCRDRSGFHLNRVETNGRSAGCFIYALCSALL